MLKTGFQGSLEQVVAIWERNAANWQARRIPWRPSPGDMILYRKLIHAHLPGRVLIMGATPELRDLIASMGAKVTLVDICPEMITSTNKLLSISRPENESHVIADWCSLPFPENHFDLILGDCLWWLLSIENQNRLGDELSRVMHPDGVMVTRNHFCNTDILGKDLGALIHEHLSLLTGTNANKNDMRELLMSHILDATTDNQMQRFDTAKAIAAIEGKLSEKTLSETESIFLEECAAALRGRVDWSSQTRAQVIEFLERYFSIEAEISAEDYPDARFFPILKLRNTQKKSL